MNTTYISVLEQDLVNLGARILHKLATRVEYDQGNLAIAQDTQLVRFLHETLLSFQKGDLDVKYENMLQVVIERIEDCT